LMKRKSLPLNKKRGGFAGDIAALGWTQIPSPPPVFWVVI